MKFPIFGTIIIIFCDMLCEVDGGLKCTFSHLITLKNKKDHRPIIKKKDIANMFTLI
jgi:hypothetical protein